MQEIDLAVESPPTKVEPYWYSVVELTRFSIFSSGSCLRSICLIQAVCKETVHLLEVGNICLTSNMDPEETNKHYTLG